MKKMSLYALALPGCRTEKETPSAMAVEHPAKGMETGVEPDRKQLSYWEYFAPVALARA
jgi:hypothetical protein